jgi:hypothetical protein
MATLAVMVFALGAAANAKTYTFTPTNMGVLDHADYYTWGFDLNVPKGQTITDAVLTISNIQNIGNDPSNELYIHLLDNPKLGVVEKTDTTNGDQFLNQGVLVGTYHANKPNQPVTLTYDFKNLGLVKDLDQYLANGIAGFGFDPDCHFTDCGIKFTVTTAKTPCPPVPEPSSMLGLLGGVSMAGVSLFRRRK